MILGFAILAASAASQEPAPAIRVDVDVVNVLCTVRNRHGALVTNLKREDFHIFENGSPQQIRYFAQETDMPLTVALLVDVSGSVRSFVTDEKGAAIRFFQQVLRPTDQAMLVGFSSTIVLWQDLTSSTRLLAAALQKLRPVSFRGLPAADQPMPSTLLYEAVQRTARQKLQDLPGRKVMVVISDGLDNGSPIPLDEAVKEVQLTNTIVYGICFESAFPGCSFLKSMSEPTGGRTFPVKKIPLDRIFQTIQDEMRSQYALGYVSTNRAHDGSYRKLQLRVLPKGLKVEARKGYYALQDQPR